MDFSTRIDTLLRLESYMKLSTKYIIYGSSTESYFLQTFLLEGTVQEADGKRTESRTCRIALVLTQRYNLRWLLHDPVESEVK